MSIVIPDPPMPGNTGGSSGGSSGGGSSSGGSSSSSSSGGRAPAPATQAQQLAERRAQNAFAELQRSYLEVLRKLGIKPTKNLLNLVEKGVRKAWSTTMFMAMLRHTPEYQQRFPGIQWRLGMTEGQYLSQYAQYKARAQDIGLNITRKQFGKMVRSGVSFEEFSDRVDALSSLRSYAPMWNLFQEVLTERGVKVPGGALGRREMMKFIMGRGSKQWEQVWQETFLAANLEQVAGVDVEGIGTEGTGGPGISRQSLLQIIKSVEALSGGKLELEKAGIDFAGLGEHLRAFDLNYMQRYGLTYADLVRARLGGVGAAEIRAKAERVQATQEAFGEQRALPDTQQTGPASQRRAQREELPQSQ